MIKRLLLLLQPQDNVVDTVFPNMSLLDDFNRANSDDLGANWGIDIEGARTPSLKISSNTAISAEEGSTFSSNYWMNGSFDDLWAILDIGTVPGLSESSAMGYALYFRVPDPGGMTEGYVVILEITNVNPGKIVILHAASLIAQENLSFTPESGDRLGVKLSGPNIEVYVFHDGEWLLINSLSNLSYLSAGSVGVGLKQVAAIGNVSINNVYIKEM